MKTFLRYAWPLLGLLAIQAWLLAVTVPVPHARFSVRDRNLTWLAVDFGVAVAQGASYRSRSKLQRELKEAQRKRDEAIAEWMNGRRA